MGIDSAANLAVVLSLNRFDQARLTVSLPGDERDTPEYTRLLETLNAALTDLFFSQELVPVQHCGYALEQFLRNLMEEMMPEREHEKAHHLVFHVIGDEAAFHLACLLPLVQRDAALDELDFFAERLECFNHLVQVWNAVSRGETGMEFDSLEN